MQDRGEYEGQTNLQGLRHGSGKYVYPNSYFTYEGDWDCGHKHGHGRLLLGDGSSYEGSFVKGEIEGQGKRVWPSGATYTGHFHLGERSGQGTLVSEDHTKYQGAWQHNKRHGRGTFHSTDGSVYDGEFLEHRQTGQGTLKKSDGETYTGQWLNGERHGRGLATLPSGTTYDGEWHQDEPEGRGTMHTGPAEGPERVYAGVWRAGEREMRPVATVWQGLLHDPEAEKEAQKAAERAAEKPAEKPPDKLLDKPHGGAHSKAVSRPDSAAEAPAEPAWTLVVGAAISAFAVRFADADGATAAYESGRTLRAVLRQRAPREVAHEKGKKPGGKKSPEPVEPTAPTEVLSEVPLGSVQSVCGVATFSSLVLPAGTEPTAYEGQYELAFVDATPEHPSLPFDPVDTSAGAAVAVHVKAPPPPEGLSVHEEAKEPEEKKKPDAKPSKSNPKGR